MSSVWTIVHFEESFMEPLEKYRSDTLAALKKPPAQVDAIEAVVDRWNSFKAFCAKILEISQAVDPVSRLVAACELDGAVIPEIYVLRVERWVAYYRVDHEARLCTGILIQNEDDGLGPALQDIFARLAKQPKPPSSK
jgi:hypothetical protein